MERKEAIEVLRRLPIGLMDLSCEQKSDLTEALNIAIAALRSPTREQVEKMRAGCEYCKKHKINLVRIEMNYNDSPGSPQRLNPTRVPKFCPMCGSPLTDEAVDIIMQRLEALKGNG